MFLIIGPEDMKEVERFALKFDTLDEVKQFCKQTEGDHLVYKLAATASTKVVTRSRSTFEPTATRSKGGKG